MGTKPINPKVLANVRDLVPNEVTKILLGMQNFKLMNIDRWSIYTDGGGTVLSWRCIFELQQGATTTEDSIIDYVHNNIKGEYKFIGGTYFNPPGRPSSVLQVYLQNKEDAMLIKMVFS